MTRSSGLLLAGDLGATKTTLACYDAAVWPGPPLEQTTYLNRDFADFDNLLAAFLTSEPQRPTAICLGVAGPVLDQAVRMTNLGWRIEAASLRARFGFRHALLVNDLVATGAGIPLLAPHDLHTLNPKAHPAPEAVLAVLAPGSGLGETFLIPHGGDRLPCATEGGHASFAPRTDEQAELLAFMRQGHDHVSVEQVCSGLAIPDLFAFVATGRPTPDWLRTELDRAVDRTPIIVGAAIEAVRGGRPCDIAVHALALMVDILADEAANLVLKTLALGGVYIGGGLAARLLPLIDAQRFMTVFARGTYREMLARVPVQVITNPHTALLGAAVCGMNILRAETAGSA